MVEYPFKDSLPIDEVLEQEGYYKDWTHLDPEVFYSLTQISEYIKTKGYGADVRLLIAQLAEHFSLKTSQINEIERFFKDVMAELSEDKEFYSLPEIAGARRGYDTLAESLGNLSVNMINKNLGKLDQTYMSDEFLQQMAGNTPVNATPPNDGVTSEKIAPRGVQKYHLDFSPVEGIPSKNLFNNENITSGYYVRFTDGTLQVNADFSASDFIRVKPNTDYSINFFNQLAYFDKDKNFIIGEGGFQVGNKTITTPPDTAYIRLSIHSADLDKYQLEEGSIITDYENFHDSKLPTNKLTEIVPTVSIGKNLFNKDNVTNGYFINYLGEVKANAVYSLSGYIPIKPNKDYVINHYDQVAFFDENKNFIVGEPGFQLGEKTITSPVNAKYIRVSVHNPRLNTYQLEEGITSSTYEPFRLLYSTPYNVMNVSDIKETQAKTVKSVFAKTLKKPSFQVKLLGDSITAGVGGTGYNQDGDFIVNTNGRDYHVNVGGYCWANNLKDFLEEKFSCAVKNWGCSGIASRHIAQNLSTFIEDSDDLIIMQIGTNDRIDIGDNSTETLYNNLLTIANYVREQGKEIIFMSSIPATVANENTDFVRRFHMEDVDHVVFLAADEIGMDYISNYKGFMNYCDLKDTDIDTLIPDGVHPNDAGYDVMLKNIANELGIGLKRPNANW